MFQTLYRCIGHWWQTEGLPPGYEKEFSALGPVLGPRSSTRHTRREASQRCEDIGGSVSTGCGDAASQVHVTFATQPSPGPDSPKGCQEKETARWVEVLGAMLVHTPTPVGTMLGDKPRTLQLLGAGRRACSLRSRVRAVRRHLNWLPLDFDTGFPFELEHVTGYLQARQSEPCTRNALRGARGCRG